ncbi:MAG: hypothetical protein Q8Q36_02145 [bacterium]|nr:hypothetical protein [bacterium]
MWLAVSLLLIFIAEGFNIFGEMVAAKLPTTESLFSLKSIPLFILVTIGACLLLFAYSLGYQSTKNIWIVSAAAVTSILIIEPILAYAFFQQLPTKGALLGFIFGIAGFIATLTWR